MVSKLVIRGNTSRNIKRAYSKQAVQGFVDNSFGGTLLPNYSFEAVINMIDEDPVATGAIQHFVDKCSEGEWSAVKKDTLQWDSTTDDSLRYDHSFDTKVLRMTYKVGKLFKNVFLEIVRDSDGVSPVGYNILDSTNVEPITAPNGDPISYKTKQPNPSTGRYGEWPSKDIVWFKFDNRDNGFAPVDIKSLYTTLMQKFFINRFVSWAWQTGQYRVVHNFKTANETVIDDFIAYNAKSDNDFTKPFLVSGDYVRAMVRDMSEIDNLVRYQAKLDNDILIALRVPPMDAGIPDASGRSNADAQSNNLNTHIKSFKKVVKAGVDEMLRKTNRGNTVIIFGPVDKFEETMLLENAQKMKAIGFSDDAIKEYLADKGMVWAVKKLFNDVEEVPKVSNPRELDNMPSRLGKNTGAANDKVGTGQQSTTRADQLVKRAFDDVKRYWTYDVIKEDE
jgi:hypothetical protein